MIKSLIEKINSKRWAEDEPIFRDDCNWQYNYSQIKEKADAMGISLFSEVVDEDEVCSWIDESTSLLDGWVQVCTWSINKVGIEFIRHLESISSIDELKSAIKQAYDKDAINLVKFMIALLCKAESAEAQSVNVVKSQSVVADSVSVEEEYMGNKNVEIIKNDGAEWVKYRGYDLEKAYLLSRHKVVMNGEEHSLDEYSCEGVLVNPSIEVGTGYVIELTSGLKNSERARFYLSKEPSNKEGMIAKSVLKNGEWTPFRKMMLSSFGGSYATAPRYLVMSQVCFGAKEKHASDSYLSSYIGYHRMLGLLMAKHSGELIQMRDKFGGCLKNLYINHLNNNGFDNRVSNLEITTSGLNTTHYEVVSHLYEINRTLFEQSSSGKPVLRYGLSVKTIINYLAYRNLGKIVDYEDFLEYWKSDLEREGEFD